VPPLDECYSVQCHGRTGKGTGELAAARTMCSADKTMSPSGSLDGNADLHQTVAGHDRGAAT
jgi:hypothetical protein